MSRMTFPDRGDYPLPDDRQTLFALVEKKREAQPTVILLPQVAGVPA
jgi:hypothetical protein